MGKFSIILVSAVTFSMLMYSSALRNALFLSNTRTVESHSINQAQNIAQSAMMVTISEVRDNANSPFYPEENSTYAYPYEDGFDDWGEIQGSYNLVATNHGDTLLAMQSTGKYNETKYRVNVGLIPSDKEWDPIIDQAVHAENNITLTGGARIGGHATINSAVSNAVYLGSSTSIDSTLFIGPGGDPDVVVNNKHRVGEGIHVLPKELEYPMPIFPTFPPYAMTGSSVYTDQTITPADYENYYIPEIQLTGNAILNIDTAGEKRVLHTGIFDIQSGQVNITGGGSLEIYVENQVDLSGSSTVNENGDTGILNLYYRGDETVDLGDESVTLGGNTLFNGNFFSKEASIVLNGTSGIQGNVITGGLDVSIKGNAEAISRTIYAPNATVELAGTARIRGSVVSDKFEANGNAVLTYDNELDTELPDLLQEGSDFEIVYWK